MLGEAESVRLAPEGCWLLLTLVVLSPGLASLAVTFHPPGARDAWATCKEYSPDNGGHHGRSRQAFWKIPIKECSAGTAQDPSLESA